MFVMRPVQCMDITRSLYNSLCLNAVTLDVDWNSKDPTELSARLCGVERPLEGLTATGAASMLGIMHRVCAGVPTFVVADPDDAVSPDDVVDFLARMLKIEVVGLPLSTESSETLATMADGVQAKLVNVRCELVNFSKDLSILNELCVNCRPLSPSNASFIFTSVCTATDVNWLNEILPGMIVCWRN